MSESTFAGDGTEARFDTSIGVALRGGAEVGGCRAIHQAGRPPHSTMQKPRAVVHNSVIPAPCSMFRQFPRSLSLRSIPAA